MHEEGSIFYKEKIKNVASSLGYFSDIKDNKIVNILSHVWVTSTQTVPFEQISTNGTDKIKELIILFKRLGHI